MLNLLESYEFSIGPRVPEGGIPLAYLTVPDATPDRCVRLARTAEALGINSPGVIEKNTFASLDYTVANSVVSAAVTGTITSNLCLDPTFIGTIPVSGAANWVATSGSWTQSTTLGRTPTTQAFSWPHGDTPIGTTNCAYIPWDAVTDSTLTSAVTTVRTSAELAYASGEVAYRVSIWLALDPASPIDGSRASGSQIARAEETTITLNVYGVSGATESIIASRVVSYYDPETQWLLLQSYHPHVAGIVPYQKLYTDYFQLPSGYTQLRVEVVGHKAWGLRIDDVVIRSYAYRQGVSLHGGQVVPGIDGIYVGDIIPVSGSLTNPSFADSSLEEVGEFSPYGSNKLKDWSFENCSTTLTGKWSGTGAVVTTSAANGAPDHGTKMVALTTSTSATQTVTGSAHPTLAHTLYATLRLNSLAASGAVTLLVESLNVGGFTTASASGVVNPTTSWVEYSQALPANPGAINFRITISATSVSGDPGKAILVDSVVLCESVVSNAISGWIASPGLARWAGQPVLDYKPEATRDTSVFGPNRFMFTYPYGTGGSRAIVSWRAILYGPSYFSTQALAIEDVISHYNTEDMITSDPVAVTSGEYYQLQYSPAWERNISALYNFGRVFTAVPDSLPPVGTLTYELVNGGPTIRILNTGYMKVDLLGYTNSGGTAGETVLDTETMGPEGDYLPSPGEGIYEAQLDYTFGSSRNLRLTKIPAGIASIRARITNCEFRGGVSRVSVMKYTTSSATTTGSAIDCTVFRFTDPVGVRGVGVDETEAWYLNIKDGIVERPYVVPSSVPYILGELGYVAGDEITLVYTVPEFNLWPQYDHERHHVPVIQGSAAIVGDNTISLGQKNVVALKSLSINGTVLVSGSASGFTDFDATLLTMYPTVLQNLDASKGTLTFYRTFSETDVVVASYLYKSDSYAYRGFYSSAGSWVPLDLNPIYGHTRPNANQAPTLAPISVFLMPSAVYATSGNTTGSYTYKSVLSLPPVSRPKSFVQHTSLDTVPDEALTLAKVSVVPPCSVSDVGVTPIASRGGGLPESWNPESSEFVWSEMVQVPVSGYWYDSGMDILAGDHYSFTGLGTAPSTGDAHGITGLAIHWSVGTSLPASGATGTAFTDTVATGTFSSSGRLYLRVIDPTAAGSGHLYLSAKIRRNATKMGRLDISSWDGQAVSLNGVVLIEIPDGVRTGTGGYRQISTQDVQDIVDKHTPAGVLPIVRYV